VKRQKRKANATKAATPAPARLLVCDDQALVRSCIRDMLEGISSIRVVGEAASGRTAIAEALELNPDIILMDVCMPDLDGIEATRQILSYLPTTRVLAFSGNSDGETMRRMFAAGARGYLLKTADRTELLTALREVLAGECFVSTRSSNLTNWPRHD
jgi:DNA-binding NarL/FixJ family response regulator